MVKERRTANDKSLEVDADINILHEEGVYLFMDEVDNESIKPVIEFVLTHNFQKRRRLKELVIMVCSPGGEIASAFALIDVMASSTIPIRTVGLGEIASAGLCIFMAGERRVLTPNTSILSHQFSWGSSGKAHELFATMKEFELTQQRMIDLYKRRTSLSEEEIRKYLLPPHDVWLSADEALSLNICDEVKRFEKK